MNREQRARETAMRRRRGMNPERARTVARLFSETEGGEARHDLHTTCQRCGAQRMGTLAELCEPHGCGA